MGDGSKVAVVKMWTKPSFERLVAHASQYGIEIAQFEEAEGGDAEGEAAHGGRDGPDDVLEVLHISWCSWFFEKVPP